MVNNHILIIEDTHTMAALYAKYLTTQGYEVDIAETGRKGLSMIAEHVYSAIVLDLNLPDMNGMEILQHMQTTIPSVPVIVVTAYGSLGAAVDSIKHGAFDFIMKPFASARLNTTVKLAIDHSTLKRELQELKANMFDSLKKLPNDNAWSHG
ncbi:MAG: response regulator [Alphaproteobacteria bacterium]|nr:response regulator [Alphaproteobacteria bacterium]